MVKMRSTMQEGYDVRGKSGGQKSAREGLNPKKSRGRDEVKEQV